MNNIMDGLKVSLDIRKKIKEEIESENITPHLAVIQVGDNKASDVYIKNLKNQVALADRNSNTAKDNEEKLEKFVMSIK